MTLERIAEIIKTKAVIYCRVSSRKQASEGAGLDSQEHRCRVYAEDKGYQVTAVFPDDASGGGDFMNRPGMVALLAYLDAHPDENFVVIFDDLKRYARDTEFHLKLKRVMAERGATRECLNFAFDDSDEGEFFETIVAAQSQLERKQNRRQVLQKMKARVEQGYAVFRAPRGYRYIKQRGNGKVLVRDEPLASIIQEALEGYACGRFDTQSEVRQFLESRPEYPKAKSGSVTYDEVGRLLTLPIYAGYVEAPSWNISRRKGQHEGLVTAETWHKIQDRLQGGAKAPARKDLGDVFALRGFVLCADCENPLYSCESRGSSGKRYPYYLCQTKGCDSYGKSIRRDTLEGDFEELLKSLRPSQKLLALIRDMFLHAWELRRTQMTEMRKLLRREVSKLEKQIESFLDKIADATSATAVTAYERRIERLEQDRLRMQGQLETACQPKAAPAEYLELALQFFSNPWKLWDSGRPEMRRLVLRLAFEERLAYCRKTGPRTPKTTLPFNMLREVSWGKVGYGAPGLTRTGTPVKATDFESAASTNSATGARA